MIAVSGGAEAPASTRLADGVVSVPALRGVEAVAPLLEVIDELGWVAGGFARWCCSPTPDRDDASRIAPPGDLDVFFADEDAFWEASKRLVDLGACPTRQASYFLQLSVDAAFPGLGLPEVQLIHPFVDGERRWGPTKEDVVRQIDISVCRIALDGKGKSTATADSNFLEDESRRLIRFSRIDDPPAVFRHAFKYATKGYRVSDGETITLLEAWAKIEPPVREARVANGHRGYG